MARNHGPIALVADYLGLFQELSWSDDLERHDNVAILQAPVASVLQTRVERPFDYQIHKFLDLIITLAAAVKMELSFITNREL